MHTVIRIGELNLDVGNRFWHVDLKITSENDQLLNALIERMRQEISNSTG